MSNAETNSIYLDHAATTPMRDEVRDAMIPHMTGLSGNPSSVHAAGRRASSVLEEARARVAATLGARASEIVFVRGGTESDNLAVGGRADVARSEGRRPVVTHTSVEHSAVVEACQRVEAVGGVRHELPVLRSGQVDAEALDRALGERPDVVSVMWVNNETGTLLPVGDVAERTSELGVVLHTDAVQAVGKVDVRVDRVPVDLLTATGHKIGGPRGTGILYVRKGVRLHPLVRGGGQERGLRPGTEDVAGAVGMAEALALSVAEREAFQGRVGALRERLEERLRNGVPGVTVFGAEGERAPHVVNVGVPGISQEVLLAGLDMEGVMCSGGSACHSGASGPEGAASSHVLRALYADRPDRLNGLSALRFSLGRDTTADEVDRAARLTGEVVRRAVAPAGRVGT